MKRILSFLLIFSLFFTTVSAYTDTETHWAKQEISLLSDAGILTGFDGYFRPDAPLTRGEAAVILDRIMEYEEKSDAAFIDLCNAFYTDAVLKCHAAGVLEGYDGRIRPLDAVSREEAAALFCRAFHISGETADLQNYKDANLVSRWAEGYVGALVLCGSMQGCDGFLSPKAPMTRGETAKVLVGLEEEIKEAKTVPPAPEPEPEEIPPVPPAEVPEEMLPAWEEEFSPGYPGEIEELPEEVPEETSPVLPTDTVLTVEAFTVSGGYLIAPCVVTITENETAASLLARVLPAYGFTPTMDTRFYLSGIAGETIPVPDVPDYLVPHLEKNMFRFDETDYTPGALFEFDITNASGWMFTVNGVFPSTGLAETPIVPGDTVRLMYTLARGADVGDVFSAGYYPVADRTALTRYFAALSSIPQSAVETATRLTASQEEIDALLR